MSAILRHILTIGWHRLLLVFLLVWLVIIVFTAFPMIGTHLSAIDVRTSEKLSKALADLEALRKQNLELQEIFKDINAESVKGDQKEAIENFQQRLTKVEHEYSNNNKLDYINPKEEPNSEYEQLRRRIFTNTQEFWYFMRSGLLELQKKVEDLSPDVGKSIQYMLDLGGEHKRSLLHDIEQLTEVDGYASWREKEANDLSELVQKRFHYLQNPSNCETAKKLICSLNKACGYGCQMHHMAYCFIVAYALNRTVIMRSRGWVYHKNGWEDVFHPVSRTCLNFTLNKVTMNSDEPDVPIIRISNIDDVLEKPSYFPPAVPQDLAPRLIRLHNNPTAWWLGQVLKYFLKPTSKVKQRLEKEERRMGFTKPIVGVHVRRTDKKREAEYYTIEEYMVAVEEYYKQLQLKQTVMVKRIYLATDEPAVINETKEKYPEYEVLSDVGVSKSARRYSGSLFGILKDIYFLSKCDFLVCTFSSQGCGYGCQLHHAVYCFMVAYGTKRTLIMKSKGWRYHKAGWEEVFKPISDSCVDPAGESVSSWPGHPETQVINLPIIDSLSPRPPFLPLAVPEDLAPRLIRLHGDPVVWWVGQILKYLLRMQPKTASMLQETMTHMGFQRPIVGVHVRRTDKVGTEAAYHGIEEYMLAVEEYYKQLELKQTVDKKRIYLASDDPKVIADAKQKYPEYEILGDPSISKTAAVATRYTDSSLFGIINDIHMLSLSDFLVCTFSSQVCRVAYEIMQSSLPDASERFRSLDDIYYYGGQNPHNRVAVLPHEPRKNGEMSFQVGDLIGVAGNHWNGFSKGRNLGTNQIALYPSFKVKDKVETAKFPTYSEVDQVQNIDEK